MLQENFSQQKARKGKRLLEKLLVYKKNKNKNVKIFHLWARKYSDQKANRTMNTFENEFIMYSNFESQQEQFNLSGFFSFVLK